MVRHAYFGDFVDGNYLISSADWKRLSDVGGLYSSIKDWSGIGLA